MKGTYLGEFQKIVLLTILILDENAYGVSIQIGSRRGASAKRGGRRKRFYSVTNRGKVVLQNAKSLRDSLWKAIPNFSI